LGQAPDIVIADITVAAGSNANLIVESFRIVVPHFLQPVETEFCLGGEVRRVGTGSHLVWKVAHARSHKRHGVAMGLDELQVVASIPPTAGSIDDRAGRG
jgi:hypothetical protein